MKNIVCILIILFVISLSCIKKNNDTPKNCKELKSLGIIDSFSYPIRPGSAEWAELETMDQKYEAVNVPISILNNMCTHGLVYTCVYCPLFYNIIAFNSIHTGLAVLINKINSFEELINRIDANEELLDYYSSLFPPDNDTVSTNFLKTETLMQMFFTELFFAQQEFLSKMSTNDLHTVLQEVYSKLSIKRKYNLTKEYLNGSYYLICNILYYNLQYVPIVDYINRNDLLFFVNDFYPLSNTSADSLDFHISTYLTEFIQ